MRILPFLPVDDGYEPSPIDLNQEEGLLDIFQSSDCTLIEDSKIVPETLILRCALRPIPITNKSIHVNLISEGELLTSVCLYDKNTIAYGYEREIEHSQWQGIALDYVGMGRGIHQGEAFTFQGKTIDSGNIACGEPLYVKPFYYETHHYQEHQTTLPSQHFLTSPPGILNKRVLRGYGGYYKGGILLEDIQQIYYSLTATHSQTCTRLYSSFYLQKNLTPAPLGGNNLIFHPYPKEEESLSFPGAIAAGYAKIKVETDTHQVAFHSFLCESIPDHSTFVNIYFKP